jgi:hypothetical protein
MDVKEAVELAKAHIQDLFGSEKIYNLGLEEVSFDDRTQKWSVTIGFSRPWQEPANTLASIAQHMSYPTRSYKVVEIVDPTKEIKSVKNRETTS